MRSDITLLQSKEIFYFRLCTGGELFEEITKRTSFNE
jgi:hypothetical protein